MKIGGKDTQYGGKDTQYGRKKMYLRFAKYLSIFKINIFFNPRTALLGIQFQKYACIYKDITLCIDLNKQVLDANSTSDELS